ncbi:Cloroperoxidase [Mycena alexandri]|uniref:Cloroperoxidase n=1 Tax=Mycena alexandri TaxID=1745969 RepID=A0AAD6WTW1_9AGAR|nr:Cloroperoxidase [Mycena alexandri]KAJ7033499.1 Cloroperoxidase [Mycena alexandri]
MNLFKFSLLLAVPGWVVATDPSSRSSDNHVWIAPKATDLRSPCPGLNTLANHGYLPRGGKNISIPMILEAAIDGFNIGSDAIIQAAKFGLLSGDAPTTMDLDALKLHNLIEHDASLSRGDFALGDNLHFNETVFSTLLNSNPGVDYYNATSAGHVQHDRLAISLATNPNITNTPKEFLLRTRESSFYLTLMGNPITGVAPKKFVEIFFREERLPIAEGWKRPNTTITAESLNTIEGIIIDNSNWTLTQICEDLVLGPDLTI